MSEQIKEYAVKTYYIQFGSRNICIYQMSSDKPIIKVISAVSFFNGNIKFFKDALLCVCYSFCNRLYNNIS